LGVDAVAFCRMFNDSRFTRFVIKNMMWQGAPNPARIASAITRSRVTDLEVPSIHGGWFHDHFLVGLASGLRSNFRSIKIPIGMKEMASFEEIMMRERDVIALLDSARGCPQLECLHLPKVWAWNDRLDAAAARCLAACTQLSYFRIDIVFHGVGRGSPAPGVFYDSPALLAVAKSHMSIDRLMFGPQQYWNENLLQQCRAGTLGKKNQVRIYQPRFQAISSTEPALFARALFEAGANGPPLLFLGLTSNHCWLMQAE
jgi:hypothetical protein